MISLALIFESKSRTKLEKLNAYNRSNLPKKNQKKNRTHQRRCLWAEGTFFVLDVEIDIIFLLRLLSLVKSKWWMNSDLSERNREAISSFSVSQDHLSLFLFLSPYLHSLSLDFIASLFLCLSFLSFSFLRVVIFCFLNS